MRSGGYLEGISERTKKADLLGRIRELAQMLAARDDEKVGRLQEIEERVRLKYADQSATLVQIIATSTEEEWAEAVDFLENFEGLLPVALFRVYDGARTALGREADTDKTSDDEPAF